MASTEVDLANLLDPKTLLGRGEFPWTILAFPQSCVDQRGLPADPEAQDYIAAVQSLGVQVGIWLDTPTKDTAYAFVGPWDRRKLQKGRDSLEKSGRFPTATPNGSAIACSAYPIRPKKSPISARRNAYPCGGIEKLMDGAGEQRLQWNRPTAATMEPLLAMGRRNSVARHAKSRRRPAVATVELGRGILPYQESGEWVLKRKSKP